uniref:Uncharacterized protein n=1 Tax=Arundo donax TaxID=35708 RepID=A0A0A9BZ15_ARUDO
MRNETPRPLPREHPPRAGKPGIRRDPPGLHPLHADRGVDPSIGD